MTVNVEKQINAGPSFSLTAASCWIQSPWPLSQHMLKSRSLCLIVSASWNGETTSSSGSPPDWWMVAQQTQKQSFTCIVLKTVSVSESEPAHHCLRFKAVIYLQQSLEQSRENTSLNVNVPVHICIVHLPAISGGAHRDQRISDKIIATRASLQSIWTGWRCKLLKLKAVLKLFTLSAGNWGPHWFYVFSILPPLISYQVCSAPLLTEWLKELS